MVGWLDGWIASRGQRAEGVGWMVGWAVGAHVQIDTFEQASARPFLRLDRRGKPPTAPGESVRCTATRYLQIASQTTSLTCGGVICHPSAARCPLCSVPLSCDTHTHARARLPVFRRRRVGCLPARIAAANPAAQCCGGGCIQRMCMCFEIAEAF